MKQITIVVTSILLILWSLIPITHTFSKYKSNKDQLISQSVDISDRGAQVFEQNCKICHGATITAPGQRLAPPASMVKQHYTASYPAEENFVAQVSRWLDSPEQAKTLMPGAVARFGIMPPLPISDQDKSAVASYIYNTDFTGSTCNVENCQKAGKNGQGKCEHQQKMMH
jgi:mono/diheme cytochrome c family protein